MYFIQIYYERMICTLSLQFTFLPVTSFQSTNHAYENFLSSPRFEAYIYMFLFFILCFINQLLKICDKSTPMWQNYNIHLYLPHTSWITYT